jgi:hypothetical protein
MKSLINELGLQVKPFDFLFALQCSKLAQICPNNGRCTFNVKTVTVFPQVLGPPIRFEPLCFAGSISDCVIGIFN